MKQTWPKRCLWLLFSSEAQGNGQLLQQSPSPGQLQHDGRTKGEKKRRKQVNDSTGFKNIPSLANKLLDWVGKFSKNDGFLFCSQATKGENGLGNKRPNGNGVPVPVPGSPGAAPAVPEMFQPYMMAAAQQMQQLQKTLHQNAAVAAARIAQVKRKCSCSTKSLFPSILFFLNNFDE